MATVFKDRYVVVGVVTLAFFISLTAAAFAVFGNTHSTSGVGHGVSNVLTGHTYVPLAWTSPPGSQYSTSEMRHYFSDGTYQVQCASDNNGYTQCGGDWGTAPCQKRYVGGTTGLLSRHWMRSIDCPGQTHA
jgi:hypothetical protein